MRGCGLLRLRHRLIGVYTRLTHDAIVRLIRVLALNIASTRRAQTMNIYPQTSTLASEARTADLRRYAIKLKGPLNHRSARIFFISDRTIVRNATTIRSNGTKQAHCGQV